MDVKLSKASTKPDFQEEFLSEILKAAGDPSIISFAGGLPNPDSFPVEEMKNSVNKVFEKNGFRALQYTGTQGYEPLRKHISARYKKVMGLDIDPNDIIVTNGSQQALDMFAYVMIDEGDEVIVENPTYLAALQTFHLYNPKVLTVTLNEDGIDCDELEKVIKENNPKCMYIIPNFQNPTGLTYTEEVRERAAKILKESNVIVLEDNPYGELRFTGQAGHSLNYWLGEQCCLLGTFSKTAAPGFRVGWIACQNQEIKAKLLSYKSTMDLHTNIFCQMAISEYLDNYDFDAHIADAKEIYRHKAETMMSFMDKYFPAEVEFTKPEGGMFIWATMPEGVKAVDVQRAAMKKGVAVCAGDPFYEYDRDVRTMRINYSNTTDENMEKGISILADTIKEFMK